MTKYKNLLLQNTGQISTELGTKHPWMKERGRTTNGLIGPDADQIYEIWNLTIFLI